MVSFANFISEHLSDDLQRLRLSRDKWKDFPAFELAVNTIECRRKLRGKLQAWLVADMSESLVFPSPLSAEQCSSENAALYKARLAERIAGLAGESEGRIARKSGGIGDAGADRSSGLAGCLGKSSGEKDIAGVDGFDEIQPEVDTGIGGKSKGQEEGAANHSDRSEGLAEGKRLSDVVIADLTGGMGVDSWAFSHVAKHVIYNEMSSQLALAASHNFSVLGCRNISVLNHEIVPGGVADGNNLCNLRDGMGHNHEVTSGESNYGDVDSPTQVTTSATVDCGASTDADDSSRAIVSDDVAGDDASSDIAHQVGSEGTAPVQVTEVDLSSIISAAAAHQVGSQVTVDQLVAEAEAGRPDIIFIDPHRRSNTGSKVFHLQDCSPDLTILLPDLLKVSDNIVAKLSPMADISLIAKELKHIREVHVTAFDGECKELLVWIQNGWQGEFSITAYENGCSFTFLQSEESASVIDSHVAVKAAQTDNIGTMTEGTESNGKLPTAGYNDLNRNLATKGNLNGRMSRAKSKAGGSSQKVGTGNCKSENLMIVGQRLSKLSDFADGTNCPTILFEPGKALAKAGCWKLVARRSGLHPLDSSTHLYAGKFPSVPDTQGNNNAVDFNLDSLWGLGKIFLVEGVYPFSKSGIRDLRSNVSRADVSAHNLPITSDALAHKLNLPSGAPLHIFAARCSGSIARLLLP